MAFNLGKCEACGTDIDASKLKKYKGRRLCPSCVRKAREADKVACSSCGKKFSPGSLKNGLCSRCRKDLSGTSEDAKQVGKKGTGDLERVSAEVSRQLRAFREELFGTDFKPFRERLEVIEKSLGELSAAVTAQTSTLGGTLGGILERYLARVERELGEFRERLGASAPTSPPQRQLGVPHGVVRGAAPTMGGLVPSGRSGWVDAALRSPPVVFLRDSTTVGGVYSVEGFLPPPLSIRGPLPVPPLDQLRDIFGRAGVERFLSGLGDPAGDLVDLVGNLATSSMISWSALWSTLLDPEFRPWMYNTALVRAFILRAWERFLNATRPDLGAAAYERVFHATGFLLLDEFRAKITSKRGRDLSPVYDEVEFGREFPRPDYAVLACLSFSNLGFSYLRGNEVVDEALVSAPHIARLILAPDSPPGSPESPKFESLYNWLSMGGGRTLRKLRDQVQVDSTDPGDLDEIKRAFRARLRLVDWLSRKDERRYKSPHDPVLVKIPPTRRRGAKLYNIRPTLLELPRDLREVLDSELVPVECLNYAESRLQYLDEFVF
ncbi:MAG: LIM domain-containing protein [Promethearchaeota archaeon]